MDFDVDSQSNSMRKPSSHRVTSSAMDRGVISDGKLALFQQFETYKFRKVGDLKVAGCLVRNNRNAAALDGTLKARNFRKATMDMTFRGRRRHKKGGRERTQRWNVELLPPKSMIDPITMKIRWEEEEGGQRTQHGTLKLFKYAGLEDDDQHLPPKEYTVCGIGKT